MEDKQGYALDWDHTLPAEDTIDNFEKTDPATITAIKKRLPEYVAKITHITPATKSPGTWYACPICGSGTKSAKTGAFHMTDDGLLWKCFACGRGGDVFNLIAEVEGLPNPSEDFIPVLTRAKQIFNMDTDANTATDTSNNTPSTPKNEQTDKNDSLPAEDKNDAETHADVRKYANIPHKYTDYINECISHAPETDYFQERGLSDDTVAALRLGYDPERKAIVFPYDPEDCYYYTRRTDTKQFYKAKLEKDEDGAKIYEPIYDPMRHLKASEPCFVVESPLDAAAIIQSGGHACALVGTAFEKLVDYINANDHIPPLVLMLDDDEEGQKHQKELVDALKEIKGKEFSVWTGGFNRDEYPEGKPTKDANDLLRADPALLKKQVDKFLRKICRPGNIADYIRKDLSNDLQVLLRDKDRKTGFANLDARLHCLNSGLYIIGGISAAGKTTFLNQLGDQLVKGGDHVLFFSLEQSRLELVAKSLARIMFSEGMDGAITSGKIKEGWKTKSLHEATVEYLDTVGSALSIYEGNLATTVSDIEKKVRDYIQRNGVRPVCLIDYLQVIPADDATTDPRIVVNNNLVALKRMSRSLSVPVVAVSSLNRANYLYPASFESFKESGQIEYTADVVFALQLAAVHWEKIAKEKNVTVQREKMNEAIKNPRRAIELSNLKNRFGPSGWSVNFVYMTREDRYIEHEDDFHVDDYVSYYEEDQTGEDDDGEQWEDASVENTSLF